MNDQDIIRDLRSQLKAKDIKLEDSVEDLRRKKNEKIQQRQKVINELRRRPIQEGFRKVVGQNKQLEKEIKTLRQRIDRQETELNRLRHENANWLKAFNHYQKEQNQ